MKNRIVTAGVVLMIVLVLVYLEVKGILKSDVISNTVGALAGGVLSILFVFWQLDQEKKKKAKQATIDLLNLMDEFPSIVLERSLQDCLRQQMSKEWDYEMLTSEISSYTQELHLAVDRTETSLLMMTDDARSLRQFLRDVNIVQSNLREFNKCLSQFKDIEKDDVQSRIKKVIRLENVKRKTIKSMQQLIKLLKAITKEDSKLNKIAFDDITTEISNFGHGYNKVLEQISTAIASEEAEDSDENTGREAGFYRQTLLTNKVELFAPVIEKTQVKLPENIFQYYDGQSLKNRTLNDKYKEIIRQVLLYQALIGKIKYFQEKKGKSVYFKLAK